MKHRCKELGCNSMAVCRDWCPMHYKRWQLWKDPSSASRKLAALALSALVVACATAAPIDPAACVASEGMVLMPREVGAQTMRDLKDLDEALDSCVAYATKCRVRSNCS